MFVVLSIELVVETVLVVLLGGVSGLKFVLLLFEGGVPQEIVSDTWMVLDTGMLVTLVDISVCGFISGVVIFGNGAAGGNVALLVTLLDVV